jgi:hypothetical protein
MAVKDFTMEELIATAEQKVKQSIKN